MRIGHRLVLAVVPGVLGLFAVAALTYRGQANRAEPLRLIVITGVATLLSLALAWQNTRYIARRIERPAGHGPATGESAVSPLAAVATRLRCDGSADEIDAIERVQEYAALLAEGASAVSRQIDEIRLPIHILLENHFGTLNENQEEMLACARSAAEAAGTELARLREIAELDRGALNFRRDRIRVGDLLQTLEPQLVADGERAGVGVTIDVLPGLPVVAGDRIRLQEALDLLLRHLVRRALPGSKVRIEMERDQGDVALNVASGSTPTLDATVALAQRIIGAHGGRMETRDGLVRILLPGFRESASGLYPHRPSP